MWQEAGLPDYGHCRGESVGGPVPSVAQSARNLSRQTLEEFKICRPECLELELTEERGDGQPGRRRSPTMNDLHDRGVHMSIDDFGTGYSSLSYLKRFKVLQAENRPAPSCADVVDRSGRRGDRCEAIIGLSRSLGPEDDRRGRGDRRGSAHLPAPQRGCDEAQGYLFSEPLTADQFEAFVRDRSLV
jgi:EAL domain-containing protein (putative c-di-GMP-specific phosphodiesterase class I)